MSSIKDRVIAIVVEHFGLEANSVALENRFVEEIGADSLDVTELVMEFEEEFDVSIPDDIGDKLKTVGQVVSYLESLPKVAD